MSDEKKNDKNKGAEKAVSKEEFLKILDSLPEEQRAEVLRTMKFSIDGNESKLYNGGVLTETPDGGKRFLRSTGESELIYEQMSDGSQTVLQKDNRSGDARMTMVSEDEFMQIDDKGVRIYNAADGSSVELTEKGIMAHDETSSVFLGKKQSVYVDEEGHIFTSKSGKRKFQFTRDADDYLDGGKITDKVETYATGKIKSVESKLESDEKTLSYKIDFEKDGEIMDSIKSIKMSGSWLNEETPDEKVKGTLDFSLENDVLKIERRCVTQLSDHSVPLSETKLIYNFSTGEGKKQYDIYEYDDQGRVQKKSDYEEFPHDGDVDLAKKNIALYALDDAFDDRLDIGDEYGFDGFFNEMVPEVDGKDYQEALKKFDGHARILSDYLPSDFQAVDEGFKEERQSDLPDEERANLKEDIKGQKGENDGADEVTVKRFENKCSKRKTEQEKPAEPRKAQPTKKQPVNLGVLTRYKEVQGIR